MDNDVYTIDDTEESGKTENDRNGNKEGTIGNKSNMVNDTNIDQNEKGIQYSQSSSDINQGDSDGPRQKKCVVCGDKARVFNFAAITCDSCKAFFRRNAGSTQGLRCSYSNQCKIDVTTRKKCLKCRMVKCLKMGMKPELVNVKSRIMKRRFPEVSLECGHIFESNMGASDANMNSNTDRTQCEAQVVFKIQLPMWKYDAMANSSKKVTSDQNAVPAMEGLSITSRTTVHAPDGIFGNQSMDNYEGDQQNGTDCKLVSTEGKAVGGFSPDRWPGSGCFLPLIRPNNVNQDQMDTNQLENGIASHIPLAFLQSISNWKHERMQELLIRKEMAWNEPTPVVHIIKGTCALDMTMEDFYFLSRHIFDKLAKQHSRLSSFQELPVSDQVSLLNVRMREIIMLRASHLFEPQTGLIDISYPGRSHVNMDILKVFSNKFYDSTLKIKQYYPDRFRQNDIMMVILCCIGLYNGHMVKLIRPDAVEKERNVYLEILKDYLESTMNEREAGLMYKYLTNWVNLVRLWAENTLGHTTGYQFDPIRLELVKTQHCT